MSAFVIGIPAPEGLDPKAFRVRVVVDRLDGADLTADDLKKIKAVYANTKSATKRRTKSTKPAAAREARAARASRK
jgi:hypothetical protein